MLVIDNDAVSAVLRMDELIDEIEAVFLGIATGDSVHRPRIDVYVPSQCEPEGYYRWGTMEGASRSLGVHAIRMKSDVVTWPIAADGSRTEDKYCVRPGLYCGLVMLFSTNDGAPLAIINDGVLQHARVGATAALGVRRLARPDAQVVGIIGAGGMARTYLEGFAAVRPVRECRVYSRSAANREAFATEMSRSLGVPVLPVGTPQMAVRGADIVATCTNAMAPVLHGGWVEPGMHVTNVQLREWAPSVSNRIDVLVRQGTAGMYAGSDADFTGRVQSGRGHSPFAYIAGSAEEMDRIPPAQPGHRGGATDLPDFVDLATGQVPGRTAREQVTGYVNGGNQGLQFAAAGHLVYQKCRAAGLGREIPTELFLQTVRD